MAFNLMGLLGNPAFQAGMGLLSNRYDSTINPYQAASSGLLQAQQIRDHERKLKLEQEERDRMQRAREQLGAVFGKAQLPVQMGPPTPQGAMQTQMRPNPDYNPILAAIAELDPVNAVKGHIDMMGALAPNKLLNPVTPSDWTAESLAKFAETKNLGDLVRYEPKKVFNVEGASYEYDPAFGGTVSRLTGSDQAASDAARVAAAKQGGKSEEMRIQEIIDSGLDAASGIPTVKRAIELLGSVETGGVDAARLAAKQAFGIETADEAELSSALGEAVLADLRATFGAQFTEREGARLEKIRANLGKSTAGNKRLLEQALTIANSAARRAINAARSRGDEDSARYIEEMMALSLSPDKDPWEQ